MLDVPDAELLANLRGPSVVTNKNDFHFGVQALPTPNGVALNQVNMADKRFRRGKHR